MIDAAAAVPVSDPSLPPRLTLTADLNYAVGFVRQYAFNVGGTWYRSDLEAFFVDRRTRRASAFPLALGEFRFHEVQEDAGALLFHYVAPANRERRVRHHIIDRDLRTLHETSLSVEPAIDAAHPSSGWASAWDPPRNRILFYEKWDVPRSGGPLTLWMWEYSRDSLDSMLIDLLSSFRRCGRTYCPITRR
jgi:hypothetical protein